MTTVEHAAKCLLSVCDGARTKDHCGYNGIDAPFARSVLSHDIREHCQNIIDGKPIIINFDDNKVKISISDQEIIIKSTDEYKDICRSISNRKWNPKLKVWISPISVVNEVHEKFKCIADFSDDFMNELQRIQDVRKLSDKTTNGNTIKFDDLELMPFQCVGVEFLNVNNGSALIADEMGLGKTVQVLAWLRLHPEIRPVLIVCPASLKLNWRNEAVKWLDNPDIYVVNGKKIELEHEIYIINYDILKNHLSLLYMGFQVIICDESHYLKNHKTKRTKYVKELSDNIPNKILLTGTPVTNRPKELWQQLNIIDPTTYPKFFQFGIKYCDAKQNQYGWDFSGASNVDELNDELKSIMIRRKKKDVLTELPDKRRSTIYFDLKKNNLKEYRLAENNFKKWLIDNDKDVSKAMRAEFLTHINALRNLSVDGRIDNIIEWIADFIDSGEKLVVFAHHHKVIDKLYENFKDVSVTLTGETKTEDRQKAVDDFQNNPDIKLFIGNIKAAGVGITLTASSNVAFIEVPWAPSDLVQAEDRVHRIGQKNAVNIYYLLSEDTIDNTMIDILHKKADIIDKIIDGKETEFNMFYEIKKYMEEE